MPRTFANLDGLVRLSHNEGVDIRRPLLRVLTDLYVQEKSHTREEEQQYAELALRLLPAVDLATRTCVARKLSAYPHTPAVLFEALRQDAPEVATIIDERVVMTEEPSAAEPERDPPAEAVSEPYPHDAARFAAPLASEQIARAANVGEAFLHAERAERVAYLDPPAGHGAMPHASALTFPDRPGAVRRLEAAAVQHSPQDFARELQLALGIPARIAMRIAHDESGEPLLVAAKALDIPTGVFVRFALLLNARIGQSVERVFSLVRLYDRLEVEAVLPVVASWREEAARSTGRYQPLHAADAGAGAASGREHAWTPRDRSQGERDVEHETERRAIGSEPRR